MAWGDVHGPGHDEDYTSMQNRLLDHLDTRISQGVGKWSVEKTSIALIAISLARLTAELNGTLREGGDVGVVSSLVRIADAISGGED
jgi:hypothetical protein